MFGNHRKLRMAGALLLPLALAVAGCASIKKEEAYIYGMEAYAYGFPLVIMDLTKEKMTAVPKAGEWHAPINQFARAQTYVSPDFKDVVRISLNGLWSTAFLDLDKEPIVVSFPDTKGRYYVMQALNMWTDDFASVGKRTTRTGPGNFLIAGPKWNGTAPADIKQTYRSSTRFAWVLVQTVANGPKDFPEAVALENQYKLTPLSAWGKPFTPPDNVPVAAGVDIKTTPFDQMQRMDAGTFFKRLAMLMKDNAPHPADAPMLEKLKKIGVEPGKDFDISKLDPAIAGELNRAVKEVWGKLASAPTQMKTVNGWVNALNLGAFGTDYDTRAAIAWLGLGALTKEDAVYPSAFVDGNGKALDFSKKYVMHFAKDQMLPCNETWSISIYQGNFYVRNGINKYDVVPWMPLQYHTDGSLDIYVQPKSPGADKEANWLPSSPGGPMNITIRCYQPKAAFLDGTYKVPPLREVQ